MKPLLSLIGLLLAGAIALAAQPASIHGLSLTGSYTLNKANSDTVLNGRPEAATRKGLRRIPQGTATTPLS